MSERMIDIKRLELVDEFCKSRHVFDREIVWDEAWNAATRMSVDIALEILREVLRDETSELTYGAASQIQNRLHQELDA